MHLYHKKQHCILEILYTRRTVTASKISQSSSTNATVGAKRAYLPAGGSAPKACGLLLVAFHSPA